MTETFAYAVEEDPPPTVVMHEANLHNPTADELAVFAEYGRTYQDAAKEAYAILAESDTRYTDPADRTLPEHQRAAFNKMRLLYEYQHTAPAAAETITFMGREGAVVQNAIQGARSRASDLLVHYVNDPVAMRRWRNWADGIEAAGRYVDIHDDGYAARKRAAA